MSEPALRIPFAWFGGKASHTHRLLPLIPPHLTYVEPFAGSLALLFAKPPSAIEVVNDLDSGLVNFYRVLRDRATYPDLVRRIALTPYAREELQFSGATWMACDDQTERAVIATCRMARCERTEEIVPELSEQERAMGDYTSGRYAWLLTDIVRLPEPIPARGALGLWEFEMPEVAS